MNRPILLFDGECTLCNGAVQFVLDRDPNDSFLFASLQSEFGRTQLRAAGLPQDYLDSLILVDEEGGLTTGSTAALGVGARLGAPWRHLAKAARIVPRPLRDAAYSAVAKRRYGIFGKTEACRLPTPKERARFLDSDG